METPVKLKLKEPKIRVGYYVLRKTDNMIQAMSADTGLFPGEVIDQLVEFANEEWLKDKTQRDEEESGKVSHD